LATRARNVRAGLEAGDLTWENAMKSIVLMVVLIYAYASSTFPALAAEPAAEAPTVSVGQQKRLAVFLDGTWNAVDNHTNVWRMKALCAPTGRDGMPQLVYYEIGVNGIYGGLFGKGLSENIRLAYEWLIENYNDGDEIFIFGFSRGAYTARSLAGLITKLGILKPGSPIGVAQLYERYKRSDEQTIWELHEQQDAGTLNDSTLEERWMLKYSQRVKIKMVGVWDTVGSLGIPAFSIEGISRSTFGFLHTGLRIHIEHGYHALAIDEHRRDFAPTLWDVRHSNDPNAAHAVPRPITSVEQRWFVGAHANVGGGYARDLLAQAPLRWIMKKASLNGLTFRNDVDIDGDAVTAPITDSYKQFANGVYSTFSKPFFRKIGEEPEVRDDGTHTNVNETIDRSVFERWRTVPAYRPPNLVEWATRKKIDPAELINSVRADDPAVIAPD
jgi:uncharacterized protein (DUF2235 family)